MFPELLALHEKEMSLIDSVWECAPYVIGQFLYIHWLQELKEITANGIMGNVYFQFAVDCCKSSLIKARQFSQDVNPDILHSNVNQHHQVIMLFT